MKIKNIVVGITGGIAAYKALNIVSELKKSGYNVDVIMTKNATEFVAPLTFETISQNKVIVDMFEKKMNIEVEHISLAEKADLVLVVPATYNIVGKVASGIADDMLSTVISATKSKVVFALAMNTNMYNNPILAENIQKLKKYGYIFIEADNGRLACGISGAGRLKKEADIIQEVKNIMVEREKSLEGKTVLITAGRTEEPIDPVRYISNRSTGKMGYEIARAASNLGAKVILISGKASVEPVDSVRMVKIDTAKQMYEAVDQFYDKADIVIMAAAVADYRIKNYSENKIKKSDTDLVFELTRNPDILYEMGKKKSKQILIGFAAESENLIENAIKKLDKKNLDMIVGNDVSNMGQETNKIVIIDKKYNKYEYERMEKRDAAYKICEKIVEIFFEK